MQRFSAALVVLALVLGWAPLAIAPTRHLGVAAALASPQTGEQSSRADGTLPNDVYADSHSRLPLLKRDDLDERGKRNYDAAAASSPSGRPEGAAAIRLHRSGIDIRWDSQLGRQLTELAIITSAREHDQPYEWSLHEMEAIAVGLNPAVIDVVRNHKPIAAASDREAIVIEIGRDILGKHKLSSETYARALQLLGKSNLVDVVGLMAQYAGTATRLSAVNQQMPPGWKQFLPLLFTPPDDIHPDSRSRLAIIRQAPNPAAAPPALYSRGLAPEGTGPGQIARHGAGLKSLESSVGRRLTGLASLVAARAHDEQYDWTMGELAARKDGLEPSMIDVVRFQKPVTGLGERESALVQFGRELFGKHYVSAETYAQALKIFGERDLVDFVNLMAQHADDAAMLTAFDQHLPAGQEPLLPAGTSSR
jgi:4-carboxymuconolactone decarboxylase